jgi:hypothetical protein
MGIAWGESQWVAVGTGTNKIATSPDGITWTGRGTAITEKGHCVASMNVSGHYNQYIKKFILNLH